MRNRRKSLDPNDNVRSLRVVVLGQDGVGKSALTVRLLTKRFIGEYDSTLESAYRHHFMLDPEIIPLDVLDTAGRNTDRKLAICSESSDIFVILYSVTDRKSFNEAERIVKKIRGARTVTDESSVLLVGTKTDLEHLREVKTKDGWHTAKHVNCRFYEISISEGYTETMDMFRDAIRRYLDAHPYAMEPPGQAFNTSMATGNGLSGSYSNLASLGAKVDRPSLKTMSIIGGIRTTFAKRKSVALV